METNNILDTIIKNHKEILGENLVGIYLHGSLVMGCYTDNSDIDFIVVVSEPIEFKTKRKLIDAIMQIKSLPKNGLEMSVILKKYAKEFVYPTPFELHYSNSHKDKYLSDKNYICGGFEDKDLAAHLTIINHRGRCIFGKEINEVFGAVPREDYIDSIKNDIEDSKNTILEAPVYITLNLCRVLYYLREGAICSKLEGGKWGINFAPIQYKKIIKDATKVYTGEIEELNFKNEELLTYADYMLKEINEYK
jgi:streptomycin 3"-adenylyltransferase